MPTAVHTKIISARCAAHDCLEGSNVRLAEQVVNITLVGAVLGNIVFRSLDRQRGLYAKLLFG